MLRRILIADDDATNRLVLEQAVAALGHEASVAEDGAAALEMLAFQPVDLALLDLHMPRQSGLDVLRQLREFEGPNRWVPAICVTADVFTRRPVDYLDLGFHGFLSKPIQIAKLAVAIDRGLSQSIEQLRRDRLNVKLAALRRRMGET